LGWRQIASLGVAIAISGNFSGWNYGLAVGGAEGMFVAAAVLGVFYVCLTRIVGELASALPAAEGFDAYATRALGPLYGATSGVALFAGLAIGTGLAASFIAAYAESMAGIGGWPLKAGLVLTVCTMQARGARDSARMTWFTGALSLSVLVAFCAYLLPHFHLFNLRVSTSVTSDIAHLGLAGALACVPFALFFFIGVEQAALAASEARDPSRTIPRALTAAVVTALVIGFAVLVLSIGGAGVAPLLHTDDPLFAAVNAVGVSGSVKYFAGGILSCGATVALLATLFSLSFAASRQLRSLALAAQIPQIFSQSNVRHAPVVALLAVAATGIVSAMFDPNAVMVLFVFLLNLTYQLTIVSFIALRKSEPLLLRPARAWGGVPVAILSAVVSLLVLMSCFRQQPVVTTAAVLLLGGYFVVLRARARSAERSNAKHQQSESLS
jgi:ethanolamine permease